MSTNSADDNEAPPEKLARLRREAEARAGGILSGLGLLIAPASMMTAWWLTADIGTVRRVGWLVFNFSMVAILITYFPFARMSDRLRPLREIIVAPYSDSLDASYRQREIKYLFARFTKEDFRVHRKMHLWGSALATALFSTMGYAIARAWLFVLARV